jgi:hypothetical protein
MSYFHETIWKGVPKFLRRVDTALKNIGINERVPYNAPLIQFSSWMGGDRDGMLISCLLLDKHILSLCSAVFITMASLSPCSLEACLRHDFVVYVAYNLPDVDCRKSQGHSRSYKGCMLIG